MDGIGPGFVARLPASSVLLDLLLCQRGEGNGGDGEIVDNALAGDEADAGVDKMVAAGEAAEHAAGVFVVARFAENFRVRAVGEADGGVGGENDVGGIVRDGEGFFLREALDEGGRRFGGQGFFGDGAGADDMPQTGGEQEFVAAG